MNKADLQLLQAISGYPAVSILLPTHRTSPANKQDPIRVSNLVRQAADRLLQEFSKREVEPIMDRLEKLAEEVDYRYTLDGLALFVNQDIALKYYLPFELKERVVIDKTFATRDLVYALNRLSRYWVLALSEKPTRLFEGVKDTLVEVEGHDFPLVHTGAGGEGRLPGGAGVSRSAYQDEQHRQFFRKVDQAFGEVYKTDPQPLAVVGVERYLSFFNEVSGHKNAIITTMTGNHDKSAPHELADLVWPLVQENIAQEKMRYLDELDKAISQRLFASGIEHAWRMAHEGRVRLLLVEDDFHYPATLDESGLVLTPAEDATAPGVIDDAVDELIEMVMAKGGEVRFLEDGSLSDHQRIVALTRY
jgi:hypothetical protein